MSSSFITLHLCWVSGPAYLQSCAVASTGWTLPLPGIWDLRSLLRDPAPASAFPPSHNLSPCWPSPNPGLRRHAGCLLGDPALSGGEWAPHQQPGPCQAVLGRVPEKRVVGTRAQLQGVASRTPAGPERPRRDELATGEYKGETPPSLQYPF